MKVVSFAPLHVKPHLSQRLQIGRFSSDFVMSLGFCGMNERELILTAFDSSLPTC
jgi:hypothetical protein